jgi:hypothetical protein
MLSCASTSFLSVRHGRTIPAVLAVPPMPVEENQMGSNRTVRDLFGDPKELLDRRCRTALLLGIEGANVKP